MKNARPQETGTSANISEYSSENYELASNGRIKSSRANLLKAILDPNISGLNFLDGKLSVDGVVREPRSIKRDRATLFKIALRLERFGFHSVKNGLLVKTIEFIADERSCSNRCLT